MPGTRRRLVPRPRHPHISEEAVRLFAHIVDRETRGLKRGSAEYNSLSLRLHRSLARKPWDVCVLSVDAERPPPRDSDSIRFASWETAVALRRELEQAISEHDRPGVGTVPLASHPQ
jgi:hypothetical protein